MKHDSTITAFAAESQDATIDHDKTEGAENCPATAAYFALEHGMVRRRPRRLVEAAQRCAIMLLRTGRAVPETDATITKMAVAEFALERVRRETPYAYAPRRHVEALARLLATENLAAIK